MKKILGIVLLACITMLSLPAAAQHNGKEDKSPEQMAKNRTDKMKTELSLDEGQYSQVYEMNLAQINTLKPLFPTSRAAMLTMSGKKKEELKKAIEKSMEEYDAGLKGVLSAEQYKIYEDKRQSGHKGSKR